VAELLEGVVPVPALLDLVEQFGQLARHGVIWGRGPRGGEKNNFKSIRSSLNNTRLHNQKINPETSWLQCCVHNTGGDAAQGDCPAAQSRQYCVSPLEELLSTAINGTSN